MSVVRSYHLVPSPAVPLRGNSPGVPKEDGTCGGCAMAVKDACTVELRELEGKKMMMMCHCYCHGIVSSSRLDTVRMQDKRAT